MVERPRHRRRHHCHRRRRSSSSGGSGSSGGMGMVGRLLRAATAAAATVAAAATAAAAAAAAMPYLLTYFQGLVRGRRQDRGRGGLRGAQPDARPQPAAAVKRRPIGAREKEAPRPFCGAKRQGQLVTKGATLGVLR